MIPEHLRVFFWDIRAADLEHKAYPEYTIFRILELGNVEAVSWMQQTFSKSEITGVLRSERRLSAKSATYWALLYRIPSGEVAALH